MRDVGAIPTEHQRRRYITSHLASLRLQAVVKGLCHRVAIIVGDDAIHGESVTLVTETLRGRLIDLDGQVFHFETDRGERIVFTLHEASGIQPHHLEGVVRSPVRIEVTIEGAHDHATATRVGPCEQYHPEHPLPWGIR